MYNSGALLWLSNDQKHLFKLKEDLTSILVEQINTPCLWQQKFEEVRAKHEMFPLQQSWVCLPKI